nr:unnamed protein product [Spirometra erinaceieuropaei]
MHLTFFAALVCMQFDGVRPAALRRWEIADLIYHSYKRTDFKAFEEYPADLFTPLAGPFYRKLSKLAEPEALHIAVNGFRSGSRGVVSHLFPDYPWIEMGKFIIYEEHGLTTMHTIAEALPAYLLADDLLHKCLCESSAYEWKAESGGLADGVFPRCNPLPEFLKTLRDGEDNSTIACTKEEISTFCNENGTSACYYKVNRTYEGPSEETAVQFIKLSPWPVCRCKEAYGGQACERPRDSCNDPLDLTDHPELKAVIETLPDVPLVLTGNWLCDDHLKDSACIAEPAFFGNTV